MILYIARHGQTSKNKEDVLTGLIDIPLNDDGIKQAQKMGEKLKTVDLDLVYSSDLKRCVQTAGEVIKKQNKCEMVLDSRIRDRALGIFEDKNKQEYFDWAEQADVDQFQDPIPGGESLAEVQKRVSEFLNEKIIHNKYKNVLIITHSGIKKWILMILRNIELKEYFNHGFYDNASVSKVEIQPNGNNVIYKNNISHLAI